MSYFLWYFHSAHQGVCTLQIYDMQHFFFPFCTSDPQKTSSMTPGTKTTNKHCIFSFFFLCDLIKKRRGHDFWLLDSTCFGSNFSPHLSLMTKEPFPPQPLCSVRGWADSSVGIVMKKPAKHSHWPPGDYNEGHGQLLQPWHLYAAPPLIGVCCVWVWLADPPGRLQATHIHIPAMQPGC